MSDALRKSLAKGNILAIDADSETLLLYNSKLAQEGYHLSLASTWREAQERLHREHFDLVISDLQPGNGDGGETAGVILGEQSDQELFVVVPRDSAAQGVAALRHGAAGYLLRPLNADELTLRVNRSLYRIAQQGEQARLTHENTEFRTTIGTYHKCMAFLRMRDLDRLGDLVLDTLMELAGAESGLLWLSGMSEGGMRLRCRRGLAQMMAASDILDPEAREFSFLRCEEPTPAGDGGELFVPLRSAGELVGLIKIETPSERSSFHPSELLAAATVGDFAAAALQCLLHLERSEHNLLRTPGGEAYNMSFFRDHLEKELLAAQRYGRHLSLIKLVIDNHAALISRFHNQLVADALHAVMTAVGTVLRDADIISQASPGIYYLLLPETDMWGALMTQRRIRKAIQGLLIISDMKKNMGIRVLMRSASCPGDGPTLAVLDRAAESRLATLRKSILLRGNFENAPFWKTVDTLLGADPRFPATLFERDGGGRYFRLGGDQVEELCGAICHEILETHQGRGVALRGCADFDVARKAMRLSSGRTERGLSLYLLGGRNRLDDAEAGLIPLHIVEPALADRTFLLCLGEGYAYALFARRDGEEWLAFHTGDFYFVENLLAKLQDQYQLQTQI